MPPQAHKYYRCRFCGHTLPAWLPVAKQPEGAMLLNHLSAMHPSEVGPLLRRMETEDIGTVAMKAFERVDPQPPREGPRVRLTCPNCGGP